MAGDLLKIKVPVKGINRPACRVDLDPGDTVKHAVAGATFDFPEIDDGLENVEKVEIKDGVELDLGFIVNEEIELVVTLKT